MKDERKQKFKGAICKVPLGVFFDFLQLGFRATVDRLKTFITILVKHIYASGNRTS